MAVITSQNGTSPSGVLRALDLRPLLVPVFRDEQAGIEYWGYKQGQRCPRNVAASYQASYDLWQLDEADARSRGLTRHPGAWHTFLDNVLAALLRVMEPHDALEMVFLPPSRERINMIQEMDALAILRELEWIVDPVAEGKETPLTGDSSSLPKDASPRRSGLASTASE